VCICRTTEVLDHCYRHEFGWTHIIKQSCGFLWTHLQTLFQLCFRSHRKFCVRHSSGWVIYDYTPSSHYVDTLIAVCHADIADLLFTRPADKRVTGDRDLTMARNSSPSKVRLCCCQANDSSDLFDARLSNIRYQTQVQLTPGCSFARDHPSTSTFNPYTHQPSFHHFYTSTSYTTRDIRCLVPACV